MSPLDHLIQEFEAGYYTDPEIRNMIRAYKDGFLDEDGEAMLHEELAETLAGGVYLHL